MVREGSLWTKFFKPLCPQNKSIIFSLPLTPQLYEEIVRKIQRRSILSHIFRSNWAQECNPWSQFSLKNILGEKIENMWRQKIPLYFLDFSLYKYENDIFLGQSDLKNLLQSGRPYCRAINRNMGQFRFNFREEMCGDINFQEDLGIKYSASLDVTG